MLLSAPLTQLCLCAKTIKVHNYHLNYLRNAKMLRENTSALYSLSGSMK